MPIVGRLVGLGMQNNSVGGGLIVGLIEKKQIQTNGAGRIDRKINTTVLAGSAQGS